MSSGKDERWAEAIADAEQMIKATENPGRIRQLRAAIRVCRRRLESGEPWPVLKATDEAS